MKNKWLVRLQKLLIASVCLLLIACFIYWFSPKPELKTFIPYSSAYFDAQGQLLRINLSSDDKYRIHQKLDQIAPQLIEATILYEDQNFYQHFGVDWSAIFRAFWTTYIASERRVGASTIVMQLARLRWNLPSHTVSGKITQIARAIQLSRHYSKQQLLQAYLNLAPYGRNIEGIGAASLVYFNKPASQLSLPEALTLAVVPQNPNRRNPTTDNGFQRLLKARENLFERWQAKYPEAKHSAKFMRMPLQVRAPEQLPFIAPHFIQHIEKARSQWQSGPVHTSLNSRQQTLIEKVLQGYIDSHRNIGMSNASALLLNYKSMQIEAMVGSANFFDNSISGQVNGTTAKRSPGSTLKPFVYALAMDEGLIHPQTLMKDSPKRFAGFTPENYDKKFLGPLSATQSLILSRNVPAVDLQSQLKQRSFYRLLADAQVSELKPASHYGLALALGGGEVTAVELASLYAMLANHGRWNAVSTDKKIAPNQGKPLLSPEASFLTLEMLKNNPAPNAVKQYMADKSKRDVAWKTGTSWAFRDAWAVGISGDYVLVVWVGNFDGKGNNVFVGRSAAGPLFFDIWSSILNPIGWQLEDYYRPERLNLKRLEVCATSGDLAGKLCPERRQSWFIPGVSPIKVSKVYRNIPVNKKTQLRACWADPLSTEFKVFEFWPSDLKQIFKQAGIAIKEPPKFEKQCQLNQTSSVGNEPIITSPSQGVDYIFRSSAKDSNLIPLQAKVDSDVKTLHWFIDSTYVESGPAHQAILWSAKPGLFRVKVVDDLARTSQVRLRVINSND
jgi:penicillin-binding protein 1C